MTGDDIKAIRARLRLSTADLARITGFSVDTIRAWEQGKREPRDDNADQVMATVEQYEREAVTV